MKEKDTKKKSGSAQRVILIILCVILVLLLAVMIFGTVYLERMSSLLQRPSDTTGTYSAPSVDINTRPTDSIPSDYTGPTVDDSEITMPTEPAQVITGSNVVNVLLVGQDARPGESVARSDSMIVCTVNFSKKTITFTSFQRDMYVTIPGKWRDKLNHSFRYGAYYGDGSLTDAFALLNETLEYNFGVQVDGNAEVDFTGFQKVIDRIGGVDIELSSAEASWMNNHNGDSMHKGVNHLNGEQALFYSRIRYLDSDYGRNARQRKVLSAIVTKAKSLSILELNDLLEELLPLIWTDLSDADIMNYALRVFPILSELEIKTQQIPAEGTYYGTYVNKMSVQIVSDFEKNREILREIMSD